MPYLIQAEEREISFDLFQSLAEIMDESPDIILADATTQLRHAHGVLSVPDKAEAQRLWERFNAIGFRNFVVEKLLDVPPPETFDPHAPKIEVPVELVTVGHVDAVTEKTVEHWNPLNVHVYQYSGFLDTGLQEWTVEQHDDHCYLDLLTRTRHWRAKVGGPADFVDLLTSGDLTGAYLSASVRRLQAGDHRILRVTSDRDYDRHVSWLYQVRYAGGEATSPSA